MRDLSRTERLRFTHIELMKQRAILLLNQLKWLVIIGLIANVVFALLFMWAEHCSFGDAIWWGWVTTFTVGYGDISPVSSVGRFVAVCTMAANFIWLACLSGQITALVFINKHILSDGEQELMKARDEETVILLHELLARNQRIEEALGIESVGTREIPPFRTNQQILAELETHQHTV